MNILTKYCCSSSTDKVVSFSGSKEDIDEMYHACVRSYIPYLYPSQIIDISINGIEIEEKCEKIPAWKKPSIVEFGDLIKQDIFNELCNVSKLVYISSSLDGNVYVWKKEKKMYVTFSGTSSVMDVLVDLDFTMFHWKEDIFVHSGFKDQFMSLEKNITMEITEDIDEIYFSGHSLGSGLSTFASAYYGEKYPNIKVTCMTFAGPKVGNAGFVRWFEKHVYKSIRMCHCGDPVPLLPFWCGWNHVNNTWYIKGVDLSDKRTFQCITTSKHNLTNYIHALL
jgi:hypothetical protein